MAKNIGIITPGGDSSGINACIRAIVGDAIYYRLQVFGVYNGYQGLIEGDIQPINAHSVSGIINHYGTTKAECKLTLHASRNTPNAKGSILLPGISTFLAS